MLLERMDFFYLGALISGRMAKNLSLNLGSNRLRTRGSCFLVVTAFHLVGHYFGVLRPLYSNDPMLCSTCLEIRSFAIGAFTPITIGTTLSVLANLSTCILEKSFRLPPFKITSHAEWRTFFVKYAFKGMSRTHFLFYPIMNGFFSSMIFLGQNYHWNTYLKQHMDLSERKQ
jgi:hypothetical protein